MKVSLNGNSEAWRTVKVGDESFEVLARKPTFDEKLQESEMGAREIVDADGRRTLFRMECVIQDWKGIEGDDGPIKFSTDNLKAVCASNHAIFRALLELSVNAFRGISEETEKN